MKVALLGGSFNPPHIGHLMAALYMRSVMASDEVWLLPSYHHPLGKQLAPFDGRVAMCEAMARELGDWLKVSRVEEDVGGEGRTIELLEYLLPRHPELRFRFVVGSDILGDLPRWKSWDQIQRLVEVVVLLRPGFPAREAVGPPMADVSSTSLREALARGDVPWSLMPSTIVPTALKLYGRPVEPATP